MTRPRRSGYGRDLADLLLSCPPPCEDCSAIEVQVAAMATGTVTERRVHDAYRRRIMRRQTMRTAVPGRRP